MLGVSDTYSMTLPEEVLSRVDLQSNLNRIINTDFTLTRSDYHVSLAEERSPLHKRASDLVASMYSSRGLDTSGEALATFLPVRRRPGRATLAASRGDSVLGTLTFEVDPGNDLQADLLYRYELDELRSQGRRLCEVTRLALHPELSTREVMATLFHITFVLARSVHNRTSMLAEVHPRHAGFYKRTLGFKVVGPERICMRVGAPAVLMHLCLDFADEQISQLAGSCTRGDRNLYSLFLPHTEQEVMLKQLLLA